MRRRRDICYSCAGGRNRPPLAAGIWRKPHAPGLGKNPLKKVTQSSYSLCNRRPHMAQQITYDKAYDAVAPEDFPAMLEVPRYGRRSDAFDGIISATHDHFWDPLDKNYIDFDLPFDLASRPIMPDEPIVELRCEAVADRLDDAPEDPALQRRDPLVDLQSAARRAGRPVAVGQPVPRAARSGRAGIRRQPGARGGPPRHRLHPLHRQAAGARRCRSARPSPRCWPIW